MTYASFFFLTFSFDRVLANVQLAQPGLYKGFKCNRRYSVMKNVILKYIIFPQWTPFRCHFCDFDGIKIDAERLD